MARRQNQRVSKSIPVQLSGTDADGNPFVLLARIVNAKIDAVRVDGIDLPLRVGIVVSLQHSDEMRFYRIIWIGQAGTSTAGQIGLQALDPGNWNCGLSGSSTEAIC